MRLRCAIAFIPTAAIFAAGYLLSRLMPSTLDRPYERPQEKDVALVVTRAAEWKNDAPAR